MKKRVVSLLLLLSLCLGGIGMPVQAHSKKGVSVTATNVKRAGYWNFEITATTNSQEPWIHTLTTLGASKAYPHKATIGRWSYKAGEALGNGGGKLSFMVCKKKPRELGDWFEPNSSGGYTARRAFRWVVVKYKLKRNKVVKCIIKKVKRIKKGQPFTM